MKRLLGFIFSFLAFLSFAPVAFAQIVNTCPLPPFDKLCFDASSIGGILRALIAFIFIIAVVIALFYLLSGAVRWILSGGDKAAIEGARGSIVAAIIGLIVLFLVFLIINILLSFFNVDIGNVTVPTIPPP